jgi:hypothetical protein
VVLAVSIVGLGGTASDVSEGLTSSPTGRDPHRPTEARECWLEKRAIKGYGFLMLFDHSQTLNGSTQNCLE